MLKMTMCFRNYFFYNMINFFVEAKFETYEIPKDQELAKSICERAFRTLPIIKDREAIIEFNNWLLNHTVTTHIPGCLRIFFS